MIELLQYLLLGVTIVRGECTQIKAVATYTPGQAIITLCEGKKQVPKDIAHELGHHLWFVHLTIEEKLNWAILYNYCEQESCFAREYGKRNIEEDFATIFEDFYYTSQLYEGKPIYEYTNNKVKKAKFRYMNNLINKYAKIGKLKVNK